LKIVFYCNVDIAALTTVGFYKQNIEALRGIADEVVICTTYKEIPDDYDLMFVYWWTYALYPVLNAKIKGKPVIITGAYNFELPKFPGAVDYLSRPWYQRLLISTATRLATLNLVNSHFEKNQIEKYFKIRNCDVSYLSYPSELIAPLDECPTERLWELESKGVLSDFVFNICWLEKSNLVRKGVLDLVRAFSSLCVEQADKSYLLCAGREGDGKDLFKSVVAESNVKNRVIHLGEISEEEKKYLLHRCKVYAQPSRYEGFGLATLEAVVCGANVIATDVGAVKEVVGECGLYVNNNLELTAALERFLNDGNTTPDLLVQKVRNKFSELKFKETLSNFIEKVIK